MSNFLPVRVPLLFITPMALLIVTLVTGLEGTALGLILTQLVLTGGAALGYGVSAIAYLSLGNQLYFVQIFIGVLIVVMLPAAAAITERVKLRDDMEAGSGARGPGQIALRAANSAPAKWPQEAEQRQPRQVGIPGQHEP